MRTWDLFGTLVAGRDSSKRDGDQPEHVPIAENIARVHPQDLIVSDYYDSERAWHILRDVAGLHNDLHVSKDDKFTGKIWDTLAYQGRSPSEHFGDDPNTDYASPKSRGISAKLTTLANRTEWELTLADIGLNALAEIVREARLRTWNADPELRAMQLFQIEANFPFLYAASLWFHKKLIGGGYTKFLMSSRDCFLWKRIMDRIAWSLPIIPEGNTCLQNPSYEVIYWWTSRITRYKPSKDYQEYFSQFFVPGYWILATDFCGFGHSFVKFIHKWLHREVYPCLLIGYGDEERPCYLPYAISGWTDESSNLARHPMVIDVVNGEPVFWDDGIDWTANPYINTMHDAFDICIRAMERYRFPQPENLDELLAKTFEHMGSNLRALDPLTPFRRDEAIRAAALLEGIEGVVI